MIRFVDEGNAMAIPILAGIRELRGGDVFMDTIQRALESTRRAIQLKPRLSDDITVDVRYLLGRERVLEEILALPEQCMRELSKKET